MHMYFEPPSPLPSSSPQNNILMQLRAGNVKLTEIFWK